jgi:hypothetical protein
METPYRLPLKGGSLQTVRWFTPVPAHRQLKNKKEDDDHQTEAEKRCSHPEGGFGRFILESILAGCPTFFPGFAKSIVKTGSPD